MNIGHFLQSYSAFVEEQCRSRPFLIESLLSTFDRNAARLVISKIFSVDFGA